VVTGSVGPTVTESTARSTPFVEEEKRGRGEEEKNLSSPSSETRNLEPETLDDNDDEEVSWQSAARASLEKNKPLSVKPLAKNPELAARAVPAKTEAKKEPPKDIVAEAKSSSSDSSSPLSQNSATTQPQPPEELPPIEAQFTQEELPDDFWSSTPEPPPVHDNDNGSYDDEVVETATSSRLERNFGQTRAPKPATKLPFDMPLFNELQSLFPGKIVRIDAKQQKQTEESEESPAPSNEVVNIVESEESEG
jgi:hypothetical protein